MRNLELKLKFKKVYIYIDIEYISAPTKTNLGDTYK
jgi:hypothetical protein